MDNNPIWFGCYLDKTCLWQSTPSWPSCFCQSRLWNSLLNPIHIFSFSFIFDPANWVNGAGSGFIEMIGLGKIEVVESVRVWLVGGVGDLVWTMEYGMLACFKQACLVELYQHPEWVRLLFGVQCWIVFLHEPSPTFAPNLPATHGAIPTCEGSKLSPYGGMRYVKPLASDMVWVIETSMHG